MARVLSESQARRVGAVVRAVEAGGTRYRAHRQGGGGAPMPRIMIGEFFGYDGNTLRCYLRRADGTLIKDNNGTDQLFDIEAITDPPGSAVQSCKPMFVSGMSVAVVAHRVAGNTQYLLSQTLLYAEECECQ